MSGNQGESVITKKKCPTGSKAEQVLNAARQGIQIETQSETQMRECKQFHVK